MSHAVADSRHGSAKAWARCLLRGGRALVSTGAEGTCAVGLSHLLQLLSDHTALSQACLALPRLLSFHGIVCISVLIIR